MNEENVLSKLEDIRNLLTLSVKTVFNMDDAAIITGLSKNRLYHLVAEGRIEHFKSAAGGRKTYFTRQGLEKFMLHFRIAEHEEIQRDAANYLLNHPHK
ncbi:MAG: hypothetical protein MdMp024_0038 [Bacteroidales bacterium]